MRKTSFALTAAAIALASGVAIAQAQQGPGGPMQQDRPGTMMPRQGSGAAPGQRGPERMREMMGRRNGHGYGMMGDRYGRHGPGMMVMMMIMMDTDGNGALSLEEVQAVHARIFNYADTDDDGQLTLEEMRSFFRGGTFDPDDDDE
ncbi:MAG TPA: EF-hand domain-containing protein [Alphaproteobacteria bacterium]|nr:EF-hand domain-containing protein [Alphaproteobacteria bacterium]